MMLYSSRYKLSKMFDKWAKKEHVLNCSESAITWLYMNTLIDEYAAKKFLEKHCPPRNDKGRFIKHAHLNYTGILLPAKQTKANEAYFVCFKHQGLIKPIFEFKAKELAEQYCEQLNQQLKPYSEVHFIVKQANRCSSNYDNMMKGQ